MKKNLVYLCALLCVLTWFTSCSDEKKSGADNAWKEISKDYNASNLSLGLVSTSGSVTVNALSADKATLVLNNVVAGESSVSVDAALTKTDKGYAFEGESAGTTCKVKVSGSIEEGKLTMAMNRTLTSALAGTLNLNYLPAMGGSQMAQAYAYFNTGNEQMDAMLNGMAAPQLGSMIAGKVESVMVNLGEDGSFSFSFKKIGSSEATVMPPAKLAEMIKSYLTWFEKDDVLYLAVHKDALTILGGLNILPEGFELSSIVNILSLEGDYYTVPINAQKDGEAITLFLGKTMITKVWTLLQPLLSNISDETIQSIVNVVGGVMNTAQDIKVGLVFKK